MESRHWEIAALVAEDHERSVGATSLSQGETSTNRTVSLTGTAKENVASGYFWKCIAAGILPGCEHCIADDLFH